MLSLCEDYFVKEQHNKMTEGQMTKQVVSCKQMPVVGAFVILHFMYVFTAFYCSIMSASNRSVFIKVLVRIAL